MWEADKTDKASILKENLIKFSTGTLWYKKQHEFIKRDQTYSMKKNKIAKLRKQTKNCNIITDLINKSETEIEQCKTKQLAAL